MKIKLIIGIVIVGLMLTCVGLGKKMLEYRSNFLRMEHSFEASTQQLRYSIAENGKLVAEASVLQLKNSELEKIFPEILSEIKNLKINHRMVKHYSETVIHHQKEIITQIKDSLIADSIQRSFDYQDDYYQVSGEIQAKQIKMIIESTDSLIQVVYQGKRKRPWLWVFSPRPLQQAIHSKNPNSKIIYAKKISIVK